MSGLDWDRIRERYETRLDSEEAAGLEPIERSEQRRRERAQRELDAQRQRERRAKRDATPRPTKYDHGRMRELYEGGASMKAVARELGCDQWTVSKALKAMAVPIVKHAGGRPRKHAKLPELQATSQTANHIDGLVNITPNERVVA